MRLRTHDAPTSEEGFTLIEVLITLALISIAFVGILTAVAGMITSGVQNRSASNSSTVVRNVAEFMQTQSYSGCGPSAQNAYQAEIATGVGNSKLVLPAGWTAANVQVTAVQGWNGDSPATFTATGQCGVGGETGIELVTIQVSSPSAWLGGSFTQSLAVTMRGTPQ